MAKIKICTFGHLTIPWGECSTHHKLGNSQRWPWEWQPWILLQIPWAAISRLLTVLLFECVPHYENIKNLWASYVSRMAGNLRRQRKVLFGVLGTVWHLWITSQRGPCFLRVCRSWERWGRFLPLQEPRFPSSQVSSELGRSWGIYAISLAFMCFVGILLPVIKLFHMGDYWWFVPEGQMVREGRTWRVHTPHHLEVLQS